MVEPPPKRVVRLLSFCLLVLIGILGFGAYKLSGSHIALPTIVQKNNPGLYRVITVYDGDTIQVDMTGTLEKVRMIGVDTPETHDPRKSVQCFGVAASNFTHHLLDNQKVRLEADPTNQNRDRYDRLLRYVYLDDGTLVNKKIIAEGYGFAYVSFPFQKLGEFRRAQTLARAQNKGLWESCQVDESSERLQTNETP